MSKAEQTKAFIIERTAPVFNKKGYAGTSMSDLTAATGLTKGSIYGNFEDKDAVAIAAFDYNLKKVNALFSAEMAKETSMRDKLLVYVRLYSRFPKYPFPEGGCPVMNTGIESDDTHPALRARAGEALVGWKNQISDLVRKGIKTGEFKFVKDAEQAGLTILALIEGATMIAGTTGNAAYRTAIMRSLKTMIEGF
ncbi:MAG: TetR/AcrR family transcriptional regulator [Chitinophagaceae bacterium]|nr:MAG: TetR/AcrR family transcriptional regulator [Chitinophagaceae bacterium]